MHPLRKRFATKPAHKATPRHHDDNHHEDQSSQTRGLSASVRFFVDFVIGVTVSSVARKQARAARLALTGSGGNVLHVLVSATGDGESYKLIAHSNDMCLFTGSSPGLYVVDQTPRELEHSIYLYMSERLAGDSAVRAQIFRESATVFELPVLEGDSAGGPRSLKPRASAATG